MDMFFSTHNPLFFLMIAIFIILVMTYLFIQFFLIPQQRKFSLEKKETELRNEKKIALFTTLSPNPVVRFDRSGNILLTNNAGFELTKNDTPIGMNVQQLIPDLKGLDLTRIIDNVEEFSLDAMLGDKEFSIYIKGIPESNFGHIYLYDVTERKKAIEALIAAKEKAEEMDRLKTNFLANMSHELRTPLIGILGFSEMLSESLEGTPDEEFAKVIYSSGTRLHETLNKILDLTQIESQKLTVNNSEIEVVKKVSEEVKLFEKAAEQKGLALKIESRAEFIVAELDETLLRQILNNLLSNAVKYTNQGSITVKLRSEQTPESGVIEISVADTGIGISKQNQMFIWEPFRQESEGLGRAFEGTGLGLTIAKKFIEKLGGEILLESEEGKGSVFTVRIPCRVISVNSKSNVEAPSLRKIENLSLDAHPNEKFQILYVDDDNYASSLVKIYLKNLCVVDTVSDSESALNSIQQKHYDIIFMDINLGIGKSGIETTELIRKMAGYETTPILAITAYAMVGDREKFLSQGFSHYISKPFDKNQLISLVREIIEA
jgi:signal transduction histidine kinase/BarA-like signal transduction histidine kinase